MNAAFSVISFLLSVPLQEEISYNSLLPQSLSSSFSFPPLFSFLTPYLFLSRYHSFFAILVILLHINITKLKRILRQIAISHKYFIHNDLLI